MVNMYNIIQLFTIKLIKTLHILLKYYPCNISAIYPGSDPEVT